MTVSSSPGRSDDPADAQALGTAVSGAVRWAIADGRALLFARACSLLNGIASLLSAGSSSCRAAESAVAGAGEAELTTLIYELLDAHGDTADLAARLASDPAWDAHLDCLRDLQRTGRATLARLSRETAERPAASAAR